MQGEMGTRGTAHGAPTLPRAARCMKLQEDDWRKVSLLTQTNKTASFYSSSSVVFFQHIRISSARNIFTCLINP